MSLSCLWSKCLKQLNMLHVVVVYDERCFVSLVSLTCLLDSAKEHLGLQERLSKAGSSTDSKAASGAQEALNEASRVELERLEMKCADYESLIAEFAQQAEVNSEELESAAMNGGQHLAQQERSVFQATRLGFDHDACARTIWHHQDIWEEVDKKCSDDRIFGQVGFQVLQLPSEPRFEHRLIMSSPKGQGQTLRYIFVSLVAWLCLLIVRAVSCRKI